ncbi:MAG: FAD-binding protein, partial [Microbacterium hominis]|nr:FAD-binding protein [Microbacterium hominis]
MTDVVAALRAQLGDRVDTDPDLLERARADKSGHAAAGTPLAVVHAASVDDVQATMRIATATATPVVVRGAGTGLAGAANAGAGEIVLSVRAMARILELSLI